jgi:hypothetical protein
VVTFSCRKTSNSSISWSLGACILLHTRTLSVGTGTGQAQTAVWPVVAVLLHEQLQLQLCFWAL